jgi:3-dehydroquinate synthetase
VKKLLGKNDIEDALKRLDTLTQEEARMAIAEVLKVAQRVDDKVTTLINGA